MIGLGIGIPYTRGGVSAPTLGTTMATTHYNRVIADGGVVPAGIIGLSSVLDSVIAAYGVTDSTDFNTKVPVFLDPHYTGYKLGAGSGTTLGQAARTVYAISSSADVTQTTAASQPLLLAHSGVNYWWGSGVAGNYCSTPSAAANQITGDIEIIIKANCSNVAGTSFILAKDGATRNYAVVISSNTLFFGLNYGAGLVYSSYAAGLTNNVDFFIKVNRVQSTGVNSIYKSNDGITWTLLGQTTQSTLPIITSAIPLTIGAQDLGANPFQGKIYRATISNSIGGSPVVDFNPASYSASTSQTDWTSTTGEVWTINTGTAATGYKGVLVDRTVVMSDGIDDRLLSTYNRPDVLTQYLAANPFTTAGAGDDVLIDSNSGAWLNSIVALSGSIRNIMNGFGSNISVARTNNRLILTTTSNNASVKNAISLNNGTETTNTYTPSSSGTGINLFTRSGGATKANAIINTYIVSSAQENSTIRTALYNTIRSMNNNAF